jgi:cytochrome c-type biogenesis protein CcmH
MSVFIALSLLIIGAAVLMIVLPLMRSSSRPILDHSNSNLLILKESLQTLDLELKNGLITADQYTFQKSEIEKRTVDEVVRVKQTLEPTQYESRWLTFIFIFGVPLAVIGLYFILGNPAALFVKKDPQTVQIEAMVSELESKLKEDPKNAQGWKFLGRSYAAMNRLPEAKIAYKKAIVLEPTNDDLLADLADLVAFQNKSLNSEAQEYIEQALKINPKNPKALALKGTALFDQKNYPQAISTWNLAIAALGSQNPEFVMGLKESIKDAQEQIKMAKEVPNTNVQAHISGKVLVSPSLIKQVSPGDTVFVYARATNGPKMPLAILRFTANELPRTFDLNDSLAMSPQMSISHFNEVTILARVSKSGNAIPESGDLIGQIEHVKLGTKNLNLVIEQTQR